MRLNQSCPSDSFESLDQAVPEAKIPLLLKLITLPSFLIPSLLHSFISVFLPSFSFSVLTEKISTGTERRISPKQHIRSPYFFVLSSSLFPSQLLRKATEFSLVSPKGQIMHLMLYFLST